RNGEQNFAEIIIPIKKSFLQIFGAMKELVVSAFCGSVAKNGWGRKKLGPDSSLGINLEEALHESNLSANVAFPEPFNLSLPNHAHCLEPAIVRRAVLKLKKPSPGLTRRLMNR